MYIEAEHGTVLLRFGSCFAARDAERLREAVESLAPFSQLIVDFTEVREVQDAAFFSLSKTLGALVNVALVIRGLTLHQSRLLKYLGLPLAQARAQA